MLTVTPHHRAGTLPGTARPMTLPGTAGPMSRRAALRLAAFGLIGLTAACGSDWRVSYDAALDPAVTRTWRVTDVRVTVPETLTTSDINTWTPNFDIVWHGDPAGDRRAQVAVVMTDAIKAGVTELRGKRAVVIAATVTHFHSITPIVEQRLERSGVHNIGFSVQVFDARSNAPLTEAIAIEADAPALVGKAAHDARLRGYTQKDEIIAEVAKVMRGWLGIGPDPRGSFQRLGR